jgi:mono/diheme cytochrome c family protein
VRAAWAGALAVWLAGAAAPAGAEAAALRFLQDGRVVARLEVGMLRAACGRRVTVDDPYYGRPKTYLACPLRDVLVMAYGAALSEYADRDFFLRASDGYVKPASGERMLEEGGYLAFGDAERSTRKALAWEPIDRRQVDPGPFYLVWSRPHQKDPHRYPWPYQLVSIEVARFETVYPHTLPKGVPEAAPAWTGFAIFRTDCIACHAINGEGGKVGPDLNVPQSIVEYRPVDQIKAYIRNPQTFRYTNMPAHPHLSDEQIDAIVAYLAAMKDRKHDPGPASGAP